MIHKGFPVLRLSIIKKIIVRRLSTALLLFTYFSFSLSVIGQTSSESIRIECDAELVKILGESGQWYENVIQNKDGSEHKTHPDCKVSSNQAAASFIQDLKDEISVENSHNEELMKKLSSNEVKTLNRILEKNRKMELSKRKKARGR